MDRNPPDKPLNRYSVSERTMVTADLSNLDTDMELSGAVRLKSTQEFAVARDSLHISAGSSASPKGNNSLRILHRSSIDNLGVRSLHGSSGEFMENKGMETDINEEFMADFLELPNSSAKLGLHGKNLNGNWASVVSNNRSRANGIDLK